MKRKLCLIIIYSILALGLSGCPSGSNNGGGQADADVTNLATLNGRLADAEIKAYRLTDLLTPVETTITKGGANPGTAGTFDLGLSGIADDEWMLVAATGGTDIGNDGVTPTANAGTLYGLAHASAWRKGARLGALTDILWRYSREWGSEVSPQAYNERLDQVANVLLKQDLDGGGIGASDLLRFDSRSMRSGDLGFDYAKLFAADGYAANIYANSSDAVVRVALGDLFGPAMAFSPPAQMDEETKVSLSVFGSGSLALQSHDVDVTLLSGMESNQFVDGQTLLDTIAEDAKDQRDLFFVRSSQKLTFKAIPLGANYPEMDQTQILSWDGCDSVSEDQSQCTVDLQSNRVVTANFAYKQTTLAANHKFIDLSDRADTVLSNWNTNIDPAQVQLDVTVNILDTDLLAQMDAMAGSSSFTYYVAGIDSTAGGTPFLLKILGVASHNGNHWVLNAEEGSLADLIQQGSGLVERTLYPDDLAVASTLSVQSLSKISAFATTNPQSIAYLVPSTYPNDPTFHIRIGQAVPGQVNPGAQATKSVSGGYTINGPNGTSLTLNGSLDVTVAVQTGIEFRAYGLGGVKNFKFIPRLGVKPQVSITGNISSSFQKEVTLLTLEFMRIKFMVGPVPVWITPTVGIVLGADGRLSASLQTAVSYDMSVTGGVKYKRGDGWSTLKAASVNRDFDGPTLTGNANLRAYLSVEPTLFIYDLTGPGLKMQPGLGLNATAIVNVASPQCYDMSYALVGRVDGDFSWSLRGRLARLIGLNKSFDFPIFHWSTDLARRSYNPCSNSPSALKVIGDTSEIVTVQYTSQDRATQYTLQNNNASPGYALPWSIQVIPDDGHVVVAQKTGQLDAGASTNIGVQVVNTASLSPGLHTTRLVFKNTNSQNAASPRTIEKVVKVKVIEQLANPSITSGVLTGPRVVKIDWLYQGNIEYLDGFDLFYASRVGNFCPIVATAGWQKVGWADRTQRTISTVVPNENLCFTIEAVGKPDTQLYAYSTPYPVNRYGAYCGDGVVDVALGEQCDKGTDINIGSYGGCNANCTLAPYCGDEIAQLAYGEQCDDGNSFYGDGCTPTCRVEAF